jgi:hypothetical protein
VVIVLFVVPSETVLFGTDWVTIVEMTSDSYINCFRQVIASLKVRNPAF